MNYRYLMELCIFLFSHVKSVEIINVIQIWDSFCHHSIRTRFCSDTTFHLAWLLNDRKSCRFNIELGCLSELLCFVSELGLFEWSALIAIADNKVVAVFMGPWLVMVLSNTYWCEFLFRLLDRAIGVDTPHELVVVFLDAFWHWKSLIEWFDKGGLAFQSGLDFLIGLVLNFN